jgi:anti-sigma-K factor RskA
MRMRQSLAQFEAAFREEAAESVVRRERLRSRAAQRSRQRRHERVQKAGTFRFALLCLAIVATAVLVTIGMFEALAALAG